MKSFLLTIQLEFYREVVLYEVHCYDKFEASDVFDNLDFAVWVCVFQRLYFFFRVLRVTAWRIDRYINSFFTRHGRTGLLRSYVRNTSRDLQFKKI